jgi:predicted alternative tryptophan synthase beta-subunit
MAAHDTVTGLRYHGMAPLLSHIVELGLIEPCAYAQLGCFAAGITFARTEGIVPAPEANHAVKGAIDEALRCKSEGTSKTILFNLCGQRDRFAPLSLGIRSYRHPISSAAVTPACGITFKVRRLPVVP